MLLVKKMPYLNITVMKKSLSVLTAFLLCAVIVFTTPSATYAQENNQSTQTADDDDDDADYGWIGLIGLAGLLGLRKRDHHVTEVRPGSRV
jgi:MYXO-CTERM domain-containing protein